MAYPDRKARQAAIEWLQQQGLPVLPVAPRQDPYQHPAVRKLGQNKSLACPVKFVDRRCVPEPLFSGKNPSYLDSSGYPRIVRHALYQNRLPSARELADWFAHPSNGVMTMGGWQRIAWIDFDTKQFSDAESCDRAVTEWLAKYPALARTFTERTQSGGWRLAVRLQQDPSFTNFALSPRGKQLGEVLGQGRLTVLSPTVGPNGNPYVSVRRSNPVEVESLESIGIYRSGSFIQPQLPSQTLPPLPPLAKASAIFSLHLADLVSDRTCQIIEGNYGGEDRSAALATAARELYGWENWTAANGVPTISSSSELIQRAGMALGLDVDRIGRIIASINPLECQPALLYRGGESSCWQKVRKLGPLIYRQRCPEAIKNSIAQATGAMFRATRNLLDATYPQLAEFLSRPDPNQTTPSLETLRAWYRVARSLERSSSHLDTIRTVAEAVKSDRPVAPSAIEDLGRDYQQYWQNLRQIASCAEQILDRVGRPTPDRGHTLAGSVYQIQRNGSRTQLTISTPDRGEILAIDGGRVYANRMTQRDALALAQASRAIVRDFSQSRCNRQNFQEATL